MMVPSLRMLMVMGLAGIPVLTMMELMPENRFVWGLVFGILMAIALVDRGISGKLLERITLDIPEVIRLSRCREGSLDITIRNPGDIHALRVGLMLPESIQSSQWDNHLTVAGPEVPIRISWPITGTRQGRYLLEQVYLETHSRFSFWLVRRRITVSVEIRVYPDLYSEKKHLPGLFSNPLLGVHPRRRMGKGREFEQLREYLPGDNYEDIHWKATAKQRKPITRIYQVERTQQIYVIIDASRLSCRVVGPPKTTDASATDDTTILDRFITAALVLGLAAQRQGDLFGVVAFADRIVRYVRATRGRTGYSACRDALYTLTPSLVAPDFEELITFTGIRLRQRALILLLTHLDDPLSAENIIRYVDMMARRHVVMVTMIRPQWAAPLFASPSHLDSVEDIYSALSGHLLFSGLKETASHLMRKGAGCHLADNEKLCVDLVTQYLNIKQRQIL